MVDACRGHSVLLMEAFAQRLHPQNVYVKNLIDEGAIGKVRLITSVISSDKPSEGNIRLSRELAGGILMDKGCYCVNTARYLLGSEPISVCARVLYGDRSGVDERVSALLEFPGEAVLQFDSSFLLGPGVYQQGYEVFGESGRIRVPSAFGQIATYRRGEIVETDVFVTDQAGNTEAVRIPGAHQWQLGVEHFADCVRRGEGIAYPGENGLKNMRVIDAIYASGRERRVVGL
jgi:predicted dehydrogenase